MATTKTTIAFNGPNCGVTEAVTSFEAAAYAFLEAFNSASQHTRHVILDVFTSASDLHGLSLTCGAATLVEALGDMNATTTSANAHVPADGALVAAAHLFEATAEDLFQALEEADEATQHAISSLIGPATRPT
jgi:hypothetical protein